MSTPEPHQTTEPILDDRRMRSNVQTPVLIAATALGLWICWHLVLPFLSVLVWALTLAVLFAPLQRWLESKVKRRGVAAALCVLVVILIVVLPAVFLGERLIAESVRGAELIRSKVESGEWLLAIRERPRLAPVANWIQQSWDLPGTARATVAWMTSMAGAIVRGSVVQAMGVCLTFYLLFYFLRDRAAALQTLRSLSPLPRLNMDKMLVRLANTIYATVYGALAVSAVQGLLGGLMFWWLGLPTPLLWGVVMALLAVIPVLGAFIIWIPAALFLLLAGSWIKALILIAWGGLVVGSIDNLLRPMLIGNRLKLHTLVAFLSVVGGLLLFGPAGLMLGPLTITMTAELLESWRKHEPAPAHPHRQRPPGSDMWAAMDRCEDHADGTDTESSVQSRV